jgi:tRNA (guanine37-N1)-methyltransferase
MPKPLRFTFLTIFPHIFDSYLNESLFKRAQKAKLVDWKVLNLRDFTKDKHHKVDDRVFGGGPGMVLKLEPIHDAVAAARKHFSRTARTRVILLSPRGTPFTQSVAKRLSRFDHLVFICGRYEGVDERVAEHVADEALSIGDYVLSGGELPALVIAEATARLRKGFMHTYESLEDVKGSYPAYTRPEVFTRKGMKRSWSVPPVLLSGNHAEIAAWRTRSGKKKSAANTAASSRQTSSRRRVSRS